MPKKLPPGKRVKRKSPLKPIFLYLDDSHSGGRILDQDFHPILTSKDGLRPITNVGGVAIHPKNYDKIVEEFHSLRLKLSKEVGANDIVNFHMRQLWGQHPPYDNGKNPFFNLSYERRFYWCRALGELVSRHADSIKSFSYMADIVEMQNRRSAFYRRNDIYSSNQIILEHFKKKAKAYFNIILNPLPGLIGYSLALFGEIAEANKFRGIFVYDTSEASKGFDALDSYTIARQEGLLTSVEKVISGTCSSEPLLQLADFISYTQHREIYAKHVGSFDIGLNRLVAGLRFQGVDWSNSPAHSSKRTKAAAISTMLHYELRIQQLRILDPNWVEEYMLSPKELMVSLLQSDQGVNIIRPEKRPK